MNTTTAVVIHTQGKISFCLGEKSNMRTIKNSFKLLFGGMYSLLFLRRLVFSAPHYPVRVYLFHVDKR